MMSLSIASIGYLWFTLPNSAGETNAILSKTYKAHTHNTHSHVHSRLFFGPLPLSAPSFPRRLFSSSHPSPSSETERERLSRARATTNQKKRSQKPTLKVEVPPFGITNLLPHTLPLDIFYTHTNTHTDKVDTRGVGHTHKDTPSQSGRLAFFRQSSLPFLLPYTPPPLLRNPKRMSSSSSSTTTSPIEGKKAFLLIDGNHMQAGLIAAGRLLCWPLLSRARRGGVLNSGVGGRSTLPTGSPYLPDTTPRPKPLTYTYTHTHICIYVSIYTHTQHREATIPSRCPCTGAGVPLSVCAQGMA